MALIGSGIAYLSVKQRNASNKRNARKYITSLQTDGPDPAELKENVCLRVSSHPARDKDLARLLEMLPGRVGIFNIVYNKRLERDQWFIVTESMDDDIIGTATRRMNKPQAVEVFHMHRFIVKIQNAEQTIEIFSDIHTVLREKLVKTEFANALFDHLGLR